jgi:hypothetical protein
VKYYYLFSVIFFWCLDGLAQSITQDVIANDGGFQKQSNASIQYTIGEIVTETSKGEMNILTQGFQQGDYKIIGLKENNPD